MTIAPQGYESGTELSRRAARALPQGLAGHMNPAHNWPGAPAFISRAEGSRFWDVDGREFVDMMCAWGPIVLGYKHPEIEEAVARQHAQADCVNGAAPVMVDLAERMLEIVDNGTWTLFAKNGSDVTTLAVTLARAHTGRSTVLIANGAYHGALPWCNPDPRGTAPGDRASFEYFDYNDLASVTEAAEANRGDLAAVILSPLRQPPGFDQELPDPAFATGLRELCDHHGALLIHDEVRTGLRLDEGSSWRNLGVAADFSAWGKAIGNGFPVAALVGTEELRTIASEVFATGTFWWSGDAMAAALATLDVYRRDHALAAMREWGAGFCEGLAAAADERGVAVKVTGPPTMPYARFEDDPEHRLADVFAATCGEHGLYLHPRHNWFVSAALDERDMDQALSAVAAGLDAVRSN
jgi:glutamate-1-semialdehyde 2,1-aminomutase